MNSPDSTVVYRVGGYAHAVSRLHRWPYRMAWILTQAIRMCTLRVHVINSSAIDRRGGYILACTHLGQLEPVLISAIFRRPIDWMTRIEFFRNPLISRLIFMLNGFAVRRFGVPVSAIRIAVRRAQSGRIVGICPEGGTAVGRDSVLRGSPIKRGVCMIAQRAGVPVVTCAILGAHRLNAVKPWLPFRRGTLHIAFGEAIDPPAPDLDRRKQREAMALSIERSFVDLYAELRRVYHIPDSEVP